MDIEPIKQYIRQQQQFGTPLAAIHAALLQTGWPAEAVDRAFNEVNNQQAVSSPPPTLNTSPEPQGQVHQTHTNLDPVKPRRYGVFKALGDSFRAAGSNFGTLLVSAIIGVVAAGLLEMSSVALLGLFGLSALGFGGLLSGATITTGSIIASVIGVVIMMMLVQILSYTVILVTVSRPVFDGAEGKSSTIKDSLVNSMSQLGRVFGSTLLMYLAILGPMIGIAILAMLVAISMPGIGALISIPILGGVVWALIAALRYALAPYTTLFEPELPIKHSLKRSQDLLKSGGQWFIFKAAVLFFLVALIVDTLATNSLTGQSSAASNIIGLIVLVFANGILVMLYKHLTAVENVQKPSNDPSSSPVGTFTEYPSSTS